MRNLFRKAFKFFPGREVARGSIRESSPDSIPEQQTASVSLSASATLIKSQKHFKEEPKSTHITRIYNAGQDHDGYSYPPVHRGAGHHVHGHQRIHVSPGRDEYGGHLEP